MLLQYATWRLRDEKDLLERAAWIEAAQAMSGETAMRLVKECVQFHGGVAITAEFWLHSWVRRIVQLAVYEGSPDSHFRRVVSRLQAGASMRVNLG